MDYTIFASTSTTRDWVLPELYVWSMRLMPDASVWMKFSSLPVRSSPDENQQPSNTDSSSSKLHVDLSIPVQKTIQREFFYLPQPWQHSTPSPFTPSLPTSSPSTLTPSTPPFHTVTPTHPTPSPSTSSPSSLSPYHYYPPNRQRT